MIHIWNKPGKKQLASISKLYETDDIPFRDTKVYFHFFLGRADWYITEFDGKDTFFGYANIGDDWNAEWGYMSYKELQEVNVKGFEVDTDKSWKPKTVKEINKQAG